MQSRIMIAGTNSGCGKTTITCAILKALINKGYKTASFKCGPDYIDPMFHKEVIGAHSRNLDAFMLSKNTVKYLLAKNSQNCDVSVLEGVMGLYDGVNNQVFASSNYISNITKTPVVLVVNCKGLSLSVAPIINGFTKFGTNNIKGVILNNIAKGSYSMYKNIIETHTKVQVLGFMPYIKEAVLESRHLGLVTAKEVGNLKEKIDILAKSAEENIDIAKLVEIAQNAPKLTYNAINIKKAFDVNIGVAKDKAFCFYYEDSLNLLKEMGAKLKYFSPLRAKSLPKGISGVILGGGYPEVYTKRLSANTSMLNSIRESAEKNMPIYAECGGFMYLCNSIEYKEKTYKMAEVINTNAKMTNKLQTFGYITLNAKEDSMLLKKGGKVNAHEFHYFACESNGDAFSALKPSGKEWQTGFATKTMYAGFPHIHLYSNLSLAKGFLQECTKYKNRGKN